MGGWEAASAGEVGGVGMSSVAVGVPCIAVMVCSIYCLIPLVCT